MRKNNNHKRGYGSFFLRTAAVMLAAALAVGLVACWGYFQYDSSRVQSDSMMREANFEEWFREQDPAELTESKLRAKLAMTFGQEAWYLDRGAVLIDKQTGKVYDTKEFIWCFIKCYEDGENIEAVREAAKTAPFLDSFDTKGNFSHQYICEDPALLDQIHAVRSKDVWHDYGLEAEDFYVRDDAVIPMNCTMAQFVADVLHEDYTESKKTFSLVTNSEIPEGYVHFVKKDRENPPADALRADAAFFIGIGSGSGSLALQEAHEFADFCQSNEAFAYDASNADKTRFSLLWTKVGQNQRIIYDTDMVPRFELYTITNYSFLYEHMFHFLFFGGGLLVLLLILAALIAKIRHVRYCKDYELNEYRRSLTASLAHDLKTPLTAIAGYAENLRANVHTEKRSAYADAILENAQYMDKMIADVLDLAKLEQSGALSREQADLVQLAGEAADHAGAEEKELTVQISGTCSASVNRKMMAQAVTNLVGNAVQYTPQGGSVEITGEGKMLRISNDIAEEQLDTAHLTEPFVKGEAARGARTGSGMGLAIAAQICRLHGFALSVTSGGHRFTVTIQVK